MTATLAAHGMKKASGMTGRLRRNPNVGPPELDCPPGLGGIEVRRTGAQDRDPWRGPGCDLRT